VPAASRAEAGPALAERIVAALRRPFEINGLGLEVGASLGVAFHPEHGENADALLQRADIAMYAAKELKSGYEIFAPHHDRHSPGRLQLAGELRQAIERGELGPWYQPKIELATGRVAGLEALMRWHHPTRGLVYPADFIPIAEHTGLIVPATIALLETCLPECASWRALGLDVSVAVNLSARSLSDPRLPDRVAGLLDAAGLPPTALVLEITESMIMADPTRAAVVLDRLRAMGVAISIDDFGTGYSSLAHLRRLPVDEVKIDKSFVLGMASDRSDAIIVRSTIDLARNLGLRVVAEGVEDDEIRDRLTALGCHLAQGYGISHPLPPAAAEAWLRERAGLGAARGHAA
jgi:EAL domain-containing protein (putative c-di-GMP-specific phosphodiesterase class I)